MPDYAEKSREKVDELIENLEEKYSDFEVADKTWPVQSLETNFD